MDEKTKSFKNQPGLRDLAFHQRNCIICKHPDRLAIEEDFTHWRCPDDIATDYKLNPRGIYRHAHATGLFQRRRRNLRCVYEFFLERSGYVRCSASEIIRAARAYASVNDDGEWVEPPTTRNLRLVKLGDPTAVVIPLGPADPASLLPDSGQQAVVDQSQSEPSQEQPAPPSTTPVVTEIEGLSVPISESSPPVNIVFATPEGDQAPAQGDTQSQTDFGVTD